MAKSADDDAHPLTFLTSITDLTPTLRTSSEITSRTAARATPRKMTLLVGRTSRKQVRSKRSEIDCFANE